MTKIEQIYYRHEHLVDIYANKIWNVNNIGMEKKDLKQELRIKLFMAIKNYGKRWKKYKETGENKPVPIKFFLQSVMSNKVVDFIKQINKMPTQSLEAMNFDYGREDEKVEITATDIFVGHTNLCDLFDKGRERRIMRLYILKNFDKKEVKKIYKGLQRYEIDQVISSGLSKMRDYLENNFSEIKEYQILFSKT